MSELSRLRMEVKADIELMAIRQGDMAREVEGIASGLHDGLQGVAQQVQALALQVQVIADKTSSETGRLSREVASGSRWMQGRMRLLGERFDAVLGALEREHGDDRELLYDLRDRVFRLEGETRTR